MAETDNTLAIVWTCSSLSILLMASRLALGKCCKKKFDLGDGLTVVAIFFAFARMAFTRVVVLWHTNNFFREAGWDERGGGKTEGCGE